MRLLLLCCLLYCLTTSFVLGKKIRKLKRQHEKIEEGTKKSTRAKNQKLNSHQGTKKQLLGYPEPDGREATAYGDFGQGGPPAPGYGGLGKGGLGTEIEGIPVGMGAGGEPLGFREQEGPLPGQNFHIPGIAGPSNYDENAEVGRGNDDGNEDLSRYSDKDDIDSLAQRAVAHYDGYDNEDSSFNRDSLQQIEPDESVTKAIGRPFDPMGQSNNMDEHEDSPFQNIKQESPFQVPMRNIADQASFAESQMQQFRPESAGEPLGPQQEETPYQPQNEEEAEAPGYGEQEGENFQATGMNGAEAVLGLNEQEGMKRHKTKMAGKKTLTSAVKRKRISNKAQLKKNHH